jgi:hypothetical protein
MLSKGFLPAIIRVAASAIASTRCLRSGWTSRRLPLTEFGASAISLHRYASGEKVITAATCATWR